MKKDIHPKSQTVVFKDASSGFMFLSTSTLSPKETAEFEGASYPLVNIEISAASHPFYTGLDKVLDTTGRVDRFKKRAAGKTA